MALKHPSLLIVAAVMVLTIGIFGIAQWRSATATAEAQAVARLVNVLPGAMPGVAIEDLALGRNEFADQKARDKLDYDDVFFRAYTTPNGTFAVYIGYWRAGRFSPSFIAAHTPDRCWTLAGMKCLDMKSGYGPSFDELDLPGGEWRRFVTRDGQMMQVIFWHIVGDHLYDYGGRFHSYTHPVRRVMDVIGELFSSYGDQYFIRVSSTQPMEVFARDPAYLKVMQALNALGLHAAADQG